jgi:hypothetical protein
MPRKKPLLALQTLAVTKTPDPPFELTQSEQEFFAIELATRRILESDWNDETDKPALQAKYNLSKPQAAHVVAEARRNARRAICRPQAAHQLVASTLARVIEVSMEQGDMRGAADAAYKLSQATGTQASIKLKVLEQQQRMESLRTKLLTGQSSAEEIAANIIDDLMGGNDG